MKARVTRDLLTLAVPALAVIAWFLFPGTFAHGLIVGTVGTCAALLGAAVVFGRRMQKRVAERLRPPPLPMEVWDYAFAFRDLAGDPVPVAAYAGRVLVLNFWATWCAPCVAEMPSLARLEAATADLDVAFACLTHEEPGVVRAFVAKRGLTLPVRVFEGDAPACFRTRSIPATFVLDKTGRIVLRHLGAARWDDPGVVAFVRGLAADPE